MSKKPKPNSPGYRTHSHILASRSQVTARTKPIFNIPGTAFIDSKGVPRDKYGNTVKVEPMATKREDIIRAMKKCQSRINKLKHFVNVPLHMENDLVRKMRAKILKEEGIFNKYVLLLKFYEAEKSSIDKRELAKHENEMKETKGEIVRLNNSKIRDKIEPKIPEPKDKPVPSYTPEEIKLREAKIAADRLFNKMYKKK